jgi:signal transduction histidine kinase
MRIEQSEFHNNLVRGLAHKMNNILSLFHGYLGMLIDDKTLDRGTVQGLMQIRNSADAAAKLMERTKTLATPSSSSHWRQIEPEDFIRSLTPALQQLATRGVTLKISCAKDLPAIWVDVARLRIALKEIVKNACEASPANGVVRIVLKLHTRPVRTEGAKRAVQELSWVAIQISDKGKGIPAELTQRIFQPFFTTKHKDDAMGLGLSVALGLVQAFGGAVRMQSKPGRTTFKVLLPARGE